MAGNENTDGNGNAGPARVTHFADGTTLIEGAATITFLDDEDNVVVQNWQEPFPDDEAIKKYVTEPLFQLGAMTTVTAEQTPAKAAFAVTDAEGWTEIVRTEALSDDLTLRELLKRSKAKASKAPAQAPRPKTPTPTSASARIPSKGCHLFKFLVIGVEVFDAAIKAIIRDSIEGNDAPFDYRFFVSGFEFKLDSEDCSDLKVFVNEFVDELNEKLGNKAKVELVGVSKAKRND